MKPQKYKRSLDITVNQQNGQFKIDVFQAIYNLQRQSGRHIKYEDWLPVMKTEPRTGNYQQKSRTNRWYSIKHSKELIPTQTMP